MNDIIHKRNLYKSALILSACGIFFCISLLIGDIKFTLPDFWHTVFGHGSSLQHFIFFELRLPHTVNAFVIGCLLSLSGYLMQVMLANPLADPYTLGSSGGAAVFTLLGTLTGLTGFWIASCSFAGSIFSMLLLAVAIKNVRTASSDNLLLVGVVFAAGWGAVLSLLLILSPMTQTRPILYWLFGDIDNQQYPLFSVFFLLVGIIGSWRLRHELKILSQGTLLAKTLGVDTERLQIKLLLLSSILTAAAVSIGGTISFIGLIVPHLARMIMKTNHYFIIPSTILLGGCLLLVADIFARTIIAPEQLPIGILTTLIGIPFFIFLFRVRSDVSR